MKHIVVIALISGVMALSGCSTEKTPEPLQQIPSITLTAADKEKLVAFQKEILSIENLTDKAIKLAVGELKNVITGGEASVTLPALIDKAKAECLKTAETLAKKSIPETLPPVAKSLLVEGKTGLITAYKAYAESFEAIRSFVVDKNPMALLEYRKKNALAQEQLSLATTKLKQILTAAGVAP